MTPRTSRGVRTSPSRAPPGDPHQARFFRGRNKVTALQLSSPSRRLHLELCARPARDRAGETSKPPIRLVSGTCARIGTIKPPTYYRHTKLLPLGTVATGCDVANAGSVSSPLSLLARDCPACPPTSCARAEAWETGIRLFARGRECGLSNALERRQRGRLIFPARQRSAGVRHPRPSKLIFSAAWMSLA
jgi:hypothetical protein